MQARRKNKLHIIGYAVILFLFLCTRIFSQETSVYKVQHYNENLPFGLHRSVPEGSPRVALVLSGGGARGFSQLGVLKVLTNNGIKFSHIIGTSMGSIVGGLIASGYTVEDIEREFLTTDWNYISASENTRNELFVEQKITEDKAVLTLRLDGLTPVLPTSINTGQNVSAFLNRLSLNAPLNAIRNFDSLLYKYYAVCTDLSTGKLVMLNKGQIHKVMRASSSVSLLLPPVEIDTMLLVDGGLVANLPVFAASELKPDFTLAVNASSPLRSKEELKYAWNIADQMISIPIQIITDYNILMADFLIQPEIGNHSNTDFSGIKELIDAGTASVEKSKDSLFAELDLLYKSRIGVPGLEIRNTHFTNSDDSNVSQFAAKYNLKEIVPCSDIILDLNKLFENGNFRDLALKSEFINDTTYLTVEYELNPEIKRYKITGAGNPNKADVSDIISGLLYKPYNADSLLNSLLKVLRYYRKNGFPLAEITNVNFSLKDSLLTVSINEGIINSIIIEGNDKSNPTIITRELNISEGDVLTIERADKGFTNLKSTNLFEEIYLELERANGENILKVHLKEKISAVLRLGIGADNEYQTQVSIDIRDENLFGSGTELGAIFTGGLKSRSYILEQKSNRIFNSYLTYKARAFYSLKDITGYANIFSEDNGSFRREETGSYRYISYGMSFGLGAQVRKIGNLIFEGKYFIDKIENIENFKNLESKISVTSFAIKLNIDSQDSFPYPKSGFLVNTAYETAQASLGGRISFTKFEFSYESYFTFGTSHTIKPRLLFGFADETLPLSQQFSFGGQSSFFGFRENEIRGRQIFITSAEYRYKLPFRVFFDSYLSFRYDLGSAWAVQEEIMLKNLYHGTGFTFSLNTPIGPADFSVGRSFAIRNSFPNNVIAYGPVTFYFTIGYSY